MAYQAAKQQLGARILVVEDQRTWRDLLRNLLDQRYETRFAVTAKEARAVIRKWLPDIIVLDLQLPDGDGKDLFYEFHEQFQIPTIVVTVTLEGHEAAELLKAGAKHFVQKPYNDETLLARIQSMLKPEGSSVCATGDLRIDFERREVTRGKQQIDLTPTEYDILKYLAENVGLLLSREQIMEHVWGYTDSPTDNNLNTVINHVRGKIELKDRPARYIITKSWFGYGLANLPISE